MDEADTSDAACASAPQHVKGLMRVSLSLCSGTQPAPKLVTVSACSFHHACATVDAKQNVGRGAA